LSQYGSMIGPLNHVGLNFSHIFFVHG